MKFNILVVEDEKDIRELLSEILTAEGFRPSSSADGNSIINDIQKSMPDLILMDHIMPGKKGTDVIAEIKNHSEYSLIPIIMLTACSAEAQKIEALNIGADDYITKPFQRGELIARIKAVQRRYINVGIDKKTRKIFEFCNLLVNLATHQVFLDGQLIALTLTEFNILIELIQENGGTLSRDELRERTLGMVNVTGRTIDVHIASLRKKLKNPRFDIQTVRGVGYRLPIE